MKIDSNGDTLRASAIAELSAANANSFRDEAGFLKVGPDILNTIRAEGLGQVKDNLERWLSDSTRAGSGDDVTLGILCSFVPFSG